MDILFILIPLSLVLVVVGCWAFFWAVDSGQFDELESAGWDALSDEPPRAVPVPVEATHT